MPAVNYSYSKQPRSVVKHKMASIDVSRILDKCKSSRKSRRSSLTAKRRSMVYKQMEKQRILERQTHLGFDVCLRLMNGYSFCFVSLNFAQNNYLTTSPFLTMHGYDYFPTILTFIQTSHDSIEYLKIQCIILKHSHSWQLFFCLQ